LSPKEPEEWALKDDTSERMRPFFERHDVLVTPVSARPPVAAYPFASHWDLTGHPALAIPAGTSGDGLPLGVQLVSRKGAEGTLLALAAQLEAELGWPGRRPPVS
jgi:amidase